MNYLDGMNNDKGMESQAAEKPWAALYVISNNSDVKTHREETCRHVRSYFERHFQIAELSRVACIFAQDDYIKSQLGRDAAERGGFMPTKGMALGFYPQYVCDIIAPIDERTHKCVFPYTGMILLYGSTCETDIGLTLTFAHELQHFLQYTNEKSLWVMNKLLIGLHNEEFKVWWDFPIEIEARTTAKKVAECLFGAEPVRGYIQERIKAHITDNDVEDWKFIQSIDTAISYSLEKCTRLLVQRHRKQLEEYVQRCKDDAQAIKSSGIQLEELAAVEFGALI